MSHEIKENESAGEMHRRRIRMKDGRYMIFYTFDDESEAVADSEVALPEPQPDKQAEDEPRV
ncbi:MAG TPA: hypothetical protein VGC91_20750 [Pyrinomonadaceae bacterium]|jgi:hypothetical protein